MYKHLKYNGLSLEDLSPLKLLDLFELRLICLFELILNVPVISYGQDGTLPPFLWDFYPKLGCHDVRKNASNITQPSKPLRLLCMNWINLNTFPGQARAVNQ